MCTNISSNEAVEDTTSSGSVANPFGALVRSITLLYLSDRLLLFHVSYQHNDQFLSSSLMNSHVRRLCPFGALCIFYTCRHFTTCYKSLTLKKESHSLSISTCRHVLLWWRSWSRELGLGLWRMCVWRKWLCGFVCLFVAELSGAS